MILESQFWILDCKQEDSMSRRLRHYGT
jgi:hypothetical protein